MGCVEQGIVSREMVEVVRNLTRADALSESLLDQVEENGLSGLLFERISGKLPAEQHDNPIEYQKLRHRALLWEAVAMIRMDQLSIVLHEAKVRNLSIVLIKGIALSYQLYKSPGLRPCFDVDVFISKDQIYEVAALFNFLGYEVDPLSENSNICFQFCAIKNISNGSSIVFDIHYRINNQAKYAHVFEFEQVLSHSVAVPQIGADARALCIADAYVLACVHLQGHRLSGDSIRTIWLNDIHLILQAMNPQDVTQILEYTNSVSLARVCLKWTLMTHSVFGSLIPPLLFEKLMRSDTGGKIALIDRVNPLRKLWQQLYFQPDRSARLLFLRQLFIPSREKLYKKYPDSTQWIGILYLRRALNGLWKRVVKIGA